MSSYIVLSCAILLSLFAFSSQSQQINHNRQLINDLQEAKLKIAQLESVLEETLQNINAKTLYLKEREKVIQDMENQIQSLQSTLSSTKGGSSSLDTRIRELEEEVKLLWAASRKNNFDFLVLEAKARDAEDRVEFIASEVEKMSDIVTERWIQIQHLEQMREFNARRHQRPTRCTFLKVHGVFDVHSWEKKFPLRSYLSRAVLKLKGFWETVTKYHHELQGFIKHEMEKNKFTAALANREVVFFVASALITFPVFGALMLLSS